MSDKEKIKEYKVFRPSLEITHNSIQDYDEKTETAGFVPLRIRLKQLEQQGYIARFTSEQFDSSEIEKLWTDPKFEILPTDELEDIQEKMALRNQYILSVQKAKIEEEREKTDTKIDEKNEVVDEKSE